MTDSPREVLSYELFGTAVRELAQQIADSGWRPEIVIAIARGGLIPAGALSYALGTKAAGTLNVEFYTDIEETLPDPIVLEPLLDTAAIKSKHLLVVDDVADSGRTLALVMDLMHQYGAHARSAVLYTKPRTVIQPDYSWHTTDLWITFPWSAQRPVSPSAQSEAPSAKAESPSAQPQAPSAKADSAPAEAVPAQAALQ